jgi:hypothetical protein
VKRWRLLIALVAVPLVFVSQAEGRAATVNATGVITADPTIGETYTLTVVNTGTENLQCMQFFVASGVTVTSVAQPSNAHVGFGPTSFGGGFVPPLAPGGTAAFRFQTSAPYPANGGGMLHVSADCRTDVIVAATGPGAAAPPPPPPAKPCKCTKLTMTTTPHSFTESEGHTFEFTINYKITCTGGTGTCKGGIQPVVPIHVSPDGGINFFVSDLTIATNKGLRLSCYGRCGRLNTGEIHIVGHSKSSLTPKARRGKIFVFKFKLSCINGAVTTPEGAVSMTVVFDARGFVDRMKSDLNADGRPDNKR